MTSLYSPNSRSLGRRRIETRTSVTKLLSSCHCLGHDGWLIPPASSYPLSLTDLEMSGSIGGGVRFTVHVTVQGYTKPVYCTSVLINNVHKTSLLVNNERNVH